MARLRVAQETDPSVFLLQNDIPVMYNKKRHWKFMIELTWRQHEEKGPPEF